MQGTAERNCRVDSLEIRRKRQELNGYMFYGKMGPSECAWLFFFCGPPRSPHGSRSDWTQERWVDPVDEHSGLLELPVVDVTHHLLDSGNGRVGGNIVFKGEKSVSLCIRMMLVLT